MEQIIDQQSSTISFILSERTKAQWQDTPEFVTLIDPLWHLDEAPIVPDLNYLLKLMHLTCEADEEQSNRLFLLLESYCAIAEPQVFAEILARLMLEGGEGYPSSTSNAGEGWLGWALDYKPELARKGQMARRLWKIAAQRGEDIEKLALQSIVASLINQQELKKEAQSQVQQSGSSRDIGQDVFKYSSSRMHDVLYMLHCGPLADQCLSLWDDESVLNALVRLRDGGDQRSLENQLLGLVNLLDRFFSWIESKDYEECVEQLKLRIASYAKTPELFAFTMDAIMRYLDGRWIRSESKDEGIAKPKAISTSLIEINREREPIHYMTTDLQGGYGFSESKNAIKGKSLKERELPTIHDRGPSTRQFEVADLISRCFEGHEAGEVEQLLRRLISHLTVRVDTAMVSASSAMIKHTAQQRDRLLLRVMSENPVYRRIMTASMDQVHGGAAALCVPVIQTMLRCSIAHWSSCKNTSPRSYPKELEEATWLAQLAEQTGLIPDPVNQAAVLFPLVDSKDLGLILEQCYYVLLVRNAADSSLPQQQLVDAQAQLDASSPEISLLHRLIFKHATRTFHLMPLFAMRPSATTGTKADSM